MGRAPPDRRFPPGRRGRPARPARRPAVAQAADDRLGSRPRRRLLRAALRGEPRDDRRARRCRRRRDRALPAGASTRALPNLVGGPRPAERELAAPVGREPDLGGWAADRRRARRGSEARIRRTGSTRSRSWSRRYCSPASPAGCCRPGRPRAAGHLRDLARGLVAVVRVARPLHGARRLERRSCSRARA